MRIVDYLALDSDGDGCPDAIEGSGNFTNNEVQNDTLIGGVNSNGVPIVANGGQNTGSSRDVNIQPVYCNPSIVFHKEAPNQTQAGGFMIYTFYYY